MYTITTTNSNLAASNRVITCVEPEIFCEECGCEISPENWHCAPQFWVYRFGGGRHECLECGNGIEPDDHEPGFDPQD